MNNELNMELFTSYLRARRGELGLRDAAQQIGDISPATLSRIENGKVPDMDIFLRLCDWIGVPADKFIKREGDGLPVPTTPEIIEAHLRADRNLDDAAAEAIAKMVKAAYALGKRKSDAD